MKILARTCCLRVATLSLLAAVALPAAAQDETVPDEPLRRLFVSDKLVLNVYSEPEQAGSRVATIETGDAVDEIERGQGFVRIRLTDGREGWVGSNYLTSDAPFCCRCRSFSCTAAGASSVR